MDGPMGGREWEGGGGMGKAAAALTTLSLAGHQPHVGDSLAPEPVAEAAELNASAGSWGTGCDREEPGFQT